MIQSRPFSFNQAASRPSYPRLLRDKSLTFVRISDMFYFSSPAYFSRYVQQHLGVSPTEYRG